MFFKTKKINFFLSTNLKQNLKATVGMILKQTKVYSQKQVDQYYDLYSIQSKNAKTSNQVDKMLLSSLFSAIIGSNLDLSIYISQKINIKKNVKIGEEVIGIVQIQKYLGKNKYQLKTTAFNSKGELCIQGTAQIMQQ